MNEHCHPICTKSKEVFSKTKRFLNQLDKSTQVLLALFVVLVVLRHTGIKVFGDDVFFRSSTFSIDYFIERYKYWTSRVFIELLLMFFAHMPLIVFKVLNALVALAFPFLLARLVGTQEQYKQLLFPALCLVLMYPFSVMREAGWIATSINYLWPLAAALTAAMPFRKWHDGQKIGPAGYIFYPLCMIFACNNELACAAFIILIPVYIWAMWKQLPRFIWLYAGIVVASVLLILASPGNGMRVVEEASTWLPQFSSLSTLIKLYYGYMSLAVPLFFHTNFLLLGLTSVLCFGIFQKYTGTTFHILAALPLFAHFISGPSVLNEITLAPLQWNQYWLLFLSCVIIFCLAISLYLLADTLREFCLLFSVPLAACAARTALAFSPTMFASGTRTMLFVSASLAIAALWAYSRIHDRIGPRTLIYCRLLLLVLALVSVIH